MLACNCSPYLAVILSASEGSPTFGTVLLLGDPSSQAPLDDGASNYPGIKI